MRSNYKKIGKYIRQINLRNTDSKIDLLLGVNLDKKFMPSVANINGVDLSTYKVIKNGQFGCKLMSVGRDKKVPISKLDDFQEAIISSAYFVFEVIDNSILNPDYLMMWFSRSESDRFQWFQSGGDIRGRITWKEFCSLPIKIPSIEKQRAIVKEYNTVVNRIKLNEQLNQKLEETAQALYKHWFVDFEFPYSPPMEGCPQDGVVDKTDPQDGMVDMARPQNGVVIKRNTKNYKSLPYNPKLKERAKALRKAGNLAEVLFWQQVHKGKFKGLDFDRQKIIGNYIVDFYCANVNVVVEIDGSSHDNKQDYDAARDTYLEGLGLTVIHITDTEVKKNLDRTMMWLSNHPAFQAPLQRRGSLGYKSSGGKMVYNEELDKEIPEGWEINTLEDIATLSAGGDKPKSYSYEMTDDLNIPIYSNTTINEGIYGYTNKAKVSDKSITISARGAIIGYTVLRTTPFFPIVRLIVVTPKNKNLINYLYECICKFKYDDSGSAQGQLTVPEISTFSVLVPNEKLLEKFQKLTSISTQNIEMRKNQISKLSDLKDLLLSKLATVKDVKELEI